MKWIFLSNVPFEIAHKGNMGIAWGIMKDRECGR
jgi:hypothetical protein